jgi:hypothetical protein
MPVTHDEQRCRGKQKYGKRQDTGSIKLHENTGESAGEYHVSLWKAAV